MLVVVLEGGRRFPAAVFRANSQFTITFDNIWRCSAGVLGDKKHVHLLEKM